MKEGVREKDRMYNSMGVSACDGVRLGRKERQLVEREREEVTVE